MGSKAREALSQSYLDEQNVHDLVHTPSSPDYDLCSMQLFSSFFSSSCDEAEVFNGYKVCQQLSFQSL